MCTWCTNLHAHKRARAQKAFGAVGALPNAVPCTRRESPHNFITRTETGWLVMMLVWIFTRPPIVFGALCADMIPTSECSAPSIGHYCVHLNNVVDSLRNCSTYWRAECVVRNRVLRTEWQLRFRSVKWIAHIIIVVAVDWSCCKCHT